MAEVVPTGDSCTIAGSVGDLDEAGAALPWGVVAGYNVYRMPAGETVPAPEEIGVVANFVYFAPLRPDVTVPDDLSQLIDPDGVPQTGDEVLLFENLPANLDGSARQVGLAPVPGRNDWYAFQPVLMGDLSDWAALELVKM